MILYKVPADASDSGNYLTRYYETVCRCERCGKTFVAEPEIESTDLCAECEEKMDKVQSETVQ